MTTKIIYPLIGILVALLLSFSYNAGLFSGINNFFGDILFSAQSVDEDLVIVAIDNESIQKIGQWPWSRSVFAEALANLEKSNPRVVGIDVILSEPSRISLEDDLSLTQTLGDLAYPVVFPAEANSLYLGAHGLEASGYFETLPLFGDQPQVSLGLVNLIADNDGIVRRFPLSLKTDDKVIHSFAYEVLIRGGLDIPNELKLDEINRIVYKASPGSIRKVPFWRVLSEEVSLEDKIVFIGSTAPDLNDNKLTPLGRGLGMPGVEIHANIANQLLVGDQLVNLPKTWSILWIFLAALLPALIFLSTRNSYFDILGTFIIGLGHLYVIVLLFDKGFFADILHINLAWILSLICLLSYKAFFYERGSKEIKHIFSKYVSDDVLNELLKDPKKVSLGGEEKELTILFSDIRGFTSLSEKLEPQELFDILNDYFSAMTDKILRNEGVLDKYIGDAIMAFWGAPMESENQADHAVQAALEMIEALEKFNKKLKEEKGVEINIGIGIYTGKAIVGNLGSETRFDYTAIGDSVNAASRIEGLTKDYDAKIIIGENTKNQLKKQYKLRDLGATMVKGKAESLNIYAVDN